MLQEACKSVDMKNILSTHENKANGLACYVSKAASGYYHAAFKDTDAGEIISISIFRERSKAEAFAKSVVAD